MDHPHIYLAFRSFILFSLLCVCARVEGSSSVLFLDSSRNQYLRPQSSDVAAERQPILLPEVGAAVSVLLGFAPPSGLSAASSSKLNEVLMPNPFERPHAVFILEVKGTSGQEFQAGNSLLSSTHRTRTISGSNKVDIILPDREKVSIVSLNEQESSESVGSSTDKEVNALVSWLGASYVTDPSKSFSGELTIPLANGASMKLQISKDDHRKFIAKLVSLIRNVESAMKMHADLSGKNQGRAELLVGNFDGIKVLQHKDAAEGVVQQGTEVLFTLVSKLFDALQVAYKGEFVGAILSDEETSIDSESLLNLIFTSRPSPRNLVESPEITIARVLLVRRTLAWVTGVILLISTLLGSYFLLYMPITKDTLLYSNVKLD